MKIVRRNVSQYVGLDSEEYRIIKIISQFSRRV